MIDREKVAAFWDARAATYGRLDFESVANLEQDPRNLRLKIDDETRKVFAWTGDVTGRRVLDLGAGVGQWAFRFAERGAEVVAVERSLALVEIGRREASARGLDALEFVCAAAEQYRPASPFDLVFVSGLFVYLDDEQAEQLMRHLPSMVGPGSRVVLRDGTGRGRRHEISDRYSEHLDAHYSATYRTPEQYHELFRRTGFALRRDENMFEEGHPLNKYPETRLRLFEFAWEGEAVGAHPAAGR